ncbi:uncharacterized protein CDV56_109678 [Aspergillus thermomutatus]|uniref:Microbial-type PARG catalytic domain-containing protein n=1 Tax=Aspergillus thermomutatus TaxID=41047 RepID=A0A397I5D0_ASPTH|nr:uncharacterized protein CDV56_109678 [Aspergillus thermomutatus]RHZ68564.1 hypothetical protein CDV56_109678 [Aspergillus thermomutatus]
MAGASAGGSKQPATAKGKQKRRAEVEEERPEASGADDSNDRQEDQRAAKIQKTDQGEEEDREARTARLIKVAQETKSIIPTILTVTPQAPPDGHYYLLDGLPQLDQDNCPKVRTLVKVVEGDTFNTAFNLANAAQFLDHKDTKPVCVLNMANAGTVGGGWEHGSMAQEEELCFRSSLSFTLKEKFYPMNKLGVIYSPTVVVFREDTGKRHRWMDLGKPEWLPIVSVVSMAAQFKPAVVIDDNSTEQRYANEEDRDLMKDKMRLVLRIAATHGHRRLVLGALGCGMFRHPKHDVADCWLEVMEEKEFKGWFEAIVFAIVDTGNKTGNLEIFRECLDGVKL